LDQDIEERERIGYQLQSKIVSEVFDLELELKELKHWTLGWSDSIEARRLGLEREVLGLRQQRRSEYVKEWSDVSSLKRRRRGFILEYENLVRTGEMMV
jgi:hypothetical protein